MAVKHHKPPFLDRAGISLDYNLFHREMAAAIEELALLEGLQRKLHNSELLISPLTAKEATTSSSIEGTQSTVSDVFLYEAGGEPKHSDAQQVANYRRAMRYAMGSIDQPRPLSMGLIKELHKILLSEVRHDGPLGKFRDRVVWIAARKGDPIEKAIYVPPEPGFVTDYSENLQEYINYSPDLALIKAGMAHYQFEAVHPFIDGNGRIGRLLIPLILYCEKAISTPILYLSGYFEAYKDDYIDALHKVDKGGKYEEWLAFFLTSVAQQAKETRNLIEKIYGLHDSMKSKFGATKSPYTLTFIEFLFKTPIFTVEQAQSELNAKSPLTIKKFIDLLIDKKIIAELRAKRGRAKLYAFNPLLNLLH